MYYSIAYFGQYIVLIHIWVGLSTKRECLPQEDTKAPYVTVNVPLQIQYLHVHDSSGLAYHNTAFTFIHVCVALLLL